MSQNSSAKTVNRSVCLFLHQDDHVERTRGLLNMGRSEYYQSLVELDRKRDLVMNAKIAQLDRAKALKPKRV